MPRNILLLLLTLPCFVHAFQPRKTISIAYAQPDRTLAFTAGEMKASLSKAGWQVTIAGSNNMTKAALRIILATDSLTAGNGSRLTSQAYSIRKKISSTGTDWYITGGDAAGTMYGGFDAAEKLLVEGADALSEIDKSPDIKQRGIKFNIPLDSRTPSYTDNGDAALQNIADMWNMDFWHEFLDEMARDRYNMLSLWSLSPFPSLVDVPEYPRAALRDVKRTTDRPLPNSDAVYMATAQSNAHLVTVKKMTIAEKIRFWQNVMAYAHDRGIDCYLFTWNLFTFGLEDAGYGITDNINNKTTRDYMRKATRTLLNTYPLLKGIGLTAGENMYGIPENDKEKFLYETYGEGINDALAADTARRFTLIHRAHQADMATLKKIFSGLHPHCELDFSYKYSVAQMYSSVAPKYIYDSKFLDEIGDSKYFLTVREDGWYNLRGGSDPAFARAYFRNMPLKNLRGFYLGPDGYTWGREYISRNPESPRQLVIKKRWYKMQLIGKLAYDTSLSDRYFNELLHARFPQADAQALQTAWAKSSQVLTWVNRFHNQRAQNDYEWYPEACTSFYGFHTIDKFINRLPQSGEGILGIPAYASALANNKAMTGITPLQVADTLQAISEAAIAGVKNMQTVSDKEFRVTIDDIQAMAALGHYYANKIRGATHKHLADVTTDITQKAGHRAEAIRFLQAAAGDWKNYASRLTANYLPQHLARLHFTVDFKAIQADVEKEVTQLQHDTPEPQSRARILQQIQLSFSPLSNYYFWHLPKISLPENWAASRYLVLELYATTAQPFDLVIHNETDTLWKTGLKPQAGKWIQLGIALDDYRTLLQGKNGDKNNGKIPLGLVRGLGLRIEEPVGYPVIELRSISLLKELPAGAVLAR